MRSTWSLKTASMPRSKRLSSWRSWWASHPRQYRSKRWNTVAMPPVHSCSGRFTASMPGVLQLGRPTFGPAGDPPDPGAVHQAHVRIERPPRGDPLPVVVAQPESLHDRVAGRPGQGQHRGHRRGVLDVEGQVEVDPAGLVELFEGGDVGRELGRASALAMARRRGHEPDDPVVVEHRHPVRR